MLQPAVMPRDKSFTRKGSATRSAQDGMTLVRAFVGRLLGTGTTRPQREPGGASPTAPEADNGNQGRCGDTARGARTY